MSGIPIAVEQNSYLKRRGELNESGDESKLRDDLVVQIHEMPVTVLVPNARCQVPRSQITFFQIVKSIMVLAILG